MNNRVWIVNYNAAPPHLATMFRHICFAREMTRAGYDVRIFSANQIHNTNIEIDVGSRSYKEVDYEGVRFVHVRTKPYRGSGLRRMVEFARFPRTLRAIAGDFAPPAAIVHAAAVPFDLEMARLARTLGAKYIVEIADLWPASFVAFGLVRASNPLLRIAYAAEHWLYHVADELVFTIEGGKDYIREKGWDRASRWPVALEKVHNINQGVDFADFDAGLARPYPDADLEETDVFKVVYVGSIRRANNLSVIVAAAAELMGESDRRIRFLIYGDGDQRPELEQRCRERGIGNVVFKGRIAPADVPAVLSRADVNLFQFGDTPLAKYGLSPNKLFIYFASGKPVLSTIRPRYDLVERYGAGISVNGNPAEIAEGVRRIADASPEQYAAYCRAARKAAVDYDYAAGARKMIDLLPRIAPSVTLRTPSGPERRKVVQRNRFRSFSPTRKYPRSSMEREGVVQEIIFRALRSLNDEFPEDKKVPINADTLLFGGASLLDSLSLVSVIVDVEGAVGDEFGRTIALTDDRAMNQEVSPFTDVRALTSYIVMLLNEGDA